MKFVRLRIVLGVFLLCLNSDIQAEQIVIGASRDNSIFAESTKSGGAAAALFAGKNNQGNIRRALLHFDILGSVPASATITSAALTLHLERASGNNTQAVEMGLHRLAGDWGEGTSGATGGGGSGSNATANDATWLHSNFDTDLWTAAGGDFEAAASAVTSVGTEVGFFEWSSNSGLVSDVQDWLDDPSNNFGWALLGDESQNASARRFESREGPVDFRPALMLEFTPVPEPSGATLLLLSLLAALMVRARRK